MSFTQCENLEDFRGKAPVECFQKLILNKDYSEDIIFKIINKKPNSTNKWDDIHFYNFRKVNNIETN